LGEVGGFVAPVLLLRLVMSEERDAVVSSRPTDVRSWLCRMEELGELQPVSGANWELESGTISEINYRRKPPAALLFDRIPGYPPGYRVLTGSLANARRMAVTLGLSDTLDTAGLVQALRGKPLEWEANAPNFEPVVANDGPILENVAQGALGVNLHEIHLRHLQREVGLTHVIARISAPGIQTKAARGVARSLCPRAPPEWAAAYVKFTALSADDWPAVGVAVSAVRRDSTLGDVRVAIGAAMERALRLHDVEAQLEGARPSAELVRLAGDWAADEVKPLGDLRGSVEYKREMVRVHARRAVGTVLAGLAFEDFTR
jgi:CO dehydrogenase flavoprotein C-terminal domain/3-octaprenyl-4-hydroxybenzoate carboxy-lyase